MGHVIHVNTGGERIQANSMKLVAVLHRNLGKGFKIFGKNGLGANGMHYYQ